MAAGTRAWLLVQFQTMLPVRKPTAGALIFGLIPYLALCFSVALWDRVEPRVFGLPFNLAWLLGGCCLGSVCLWIAARFEEREDRRNRR